MPALRSVSPKRLHTASTRSASPKSKSLRDQPKSPNAFILFRSYVLAHPKLIPSEIYHQKDVSRYVALVWKELPDFERQEWFARAREEKERREASFAFAARDSLQHMSTTRHVSSSYEQCVNPMALFFEPVTFTRKVPGLDDITDADLEVLLANCMDDTPF